MIRPIQYLRALAALMVAWLHATTMFPGVIRYTGLRGGSGINLFFVISGFIMVVTTAGKPITPREFFALRLIRVVPMYWLITLIAIMLAFWGHLFKGNLSPEAILKSLLFIPYISLDSPGNAWPILLQGWTLNYEMFFYTIFALTLATPQGFRLGWLITVLSVLIMIGRIVQPINPIAFVYTNPLLLEFGLGAIIGYLWIRKDLEMQLAIALAAVGVGLWMLFSSGDLWGYSQMVGATLTVIGCLHAWIRAWDSSFLLELGNASYAIYLTHLFTLRALRIVWVKLVPHASWSVSIAFTVAAVAVCAAVGWLCYRWVEKPLTKRLRRLVRRKAVSVPVPVENLA